MSISWPSFPSFSFHMSASAPINSSVPPTVVKVVKTVDLWDSVIKFYAATALITASVHLLAGAGLDKTQMRPNIKKALLLTLTFNTFHISLFMFGFPPSALTICISFIFWVGMTLAFPPSKSFRAFQN